MANKKKTKEEEYQEGINKGLESIFGDFNQLTDKMIGDIQKMEEDDKRFYMGLMKDITEGTAKFSQESLQKTISKIETHFNIKKDGS